MQEFVSDLNNFYNFISDTSISALPDWEREIIGKDVEVTRFKGLGEINHEEFRQFITPNEIKLLPVTVEHPRELDSLLRFLMGDNTPERKEYIMKNLV